MKTFAQLKAEWDAATDHLSPSEYLRELSSHGLKLKPKHSNDTDGDSPVEAIIKDRQS